MTYGIAPWAIQARVLEAESGLRVTVLADRELLAMFLSVVLRRLQRLLRLLRRLQRRLQRLLQLGTAPDWTQTPQLTLLA